MKKQDAPKVFISYSWKPESDKQKVIELAERLSSDGVHVIIDIWDLKEGQDQYTFMEQMVNDETIEKVLIMCNSIYSSKANSKKGGVGTESQIVSAEIYNQTEQTKFIPVVLERDENGKACVPTFVKTRIYFDFSDDENFENEYDKLLRSIHKKPLHKRPPIGSMPSYLQEEEPMFSPTSNLVKRIKNALIEEKGYVNNLIQDYFEAFVLALPEYRIDEVGLTDENFIEKVDQKIEEIGVLRQDFEVFLNAYLKYSNPDWELLHGFFEKLLIYMNNESASNYPRRSIGYLALDSTRFFMYELFLSFVVIMIEKEYYFELGSILRSPFLVMRENTGMMEEYSFTEFRYWNETLDNFKNQRLGLNRVSITADTMKRRAHSDQRFIEMIHADIVLHYLAIFLEVDKSHVFGFWFPTTACYNSRMKVLPKMKSRRHFEKIKGLFGVQTKEELVAQVKKVLDEGKGERINNYHYMHVRRIDVGLAIDEIGTIS